MQKDPIEAICRKAGLAPARRETIRGRDVFVADGFSLLPHVTFRRFGIDQHDFPTGCHATIWWCARGEDKVDVGAPTASGGLAAPGKQWCPGPDRESPTRGFSARSSGVRALWHYSVDVPVKVLCENTDAR